MGSYRQAKREKQFTAEWLASMGLELKPSKTRIVHTLHKHDEQPPGFDFLGFTVRQYPVGKAHSGRQVRRKDGPVKLLGFKTIIKPSKAARQRRGRALKDLLHAYHAAPQPASSAD